MSAEVLVVRPQPGADATAARLRAVGLTPRVVPLFEVRPRPWTAPPADDFDAVLLTSANAIRHGGNDLTALTALPAWCVGEATADAARAAGFTVARTGDSDGATLLASGDVPGRMLWLRGEDARPLQRPGLHDLIVYASEAIDVPEARLAGADIAMAHSPRAAMRLSQLKSDRGRTTLMAISDAAARAAGRGWHRIVVAPRPHDAAMVAGVAQLWQEARR